jgi:hypothetical protein
MQLYANEGITPAIRRGFVVYIASHNRPPHEILSPIMRDITLDYEQTFVGMTIESVELSDLMRVRDRLVAELPQTLDPNERQFLLSLVSNAPEPRRTLNFLHPWAGQTPPPDALNRRRSAPS